MDQNSLKSFQINFTSLSRWLLPVAVIWLLGLIGLGWLVKSFVILISLILIAPVIAFLGFRWWLSRNLVQDQCPVCAYEFVGLKQAEFQCPSCGEPLAIEKGHFHRLTPPGTIDIKAVEVSAQRLED